MGNKKKSKVEIVFIIIAWLFTLSPYLLFLFIEWYYVLLITSLLFSINAYNNSTKSNYSTFKAVIITLIFNIFGSLYVTRKINENLKASFIKAREKRRAELKEEHKKEHAGYRLKAKRIAEQKLINEIKDRQVYGAIRAYGELMKVDDNMDKKEMQLFGLISKEEQKKLSKEYSQESKEFNFVWKSKENLYTALKTYNEKEIETFYENMFSMSVIDGEMHKKEILFMAQLYEKITDTTSSDALIEIDAAFTRWKNKL